MDEPSDRTTAPEPETLDLEQFESLDDALRKIQSGYRYRDLVLRVYLHGTASAPGINVAISEEK